MDGENPRRSRAKEGKPRRQACMSGFPSLHNLLDKSNSLNKQYATHNNCNYHGIEQLVF